MFQTAVIAILEPLTFRADSSMTWDLNVKLKARTNPLLLEADNSKAGTLVGMRPILQPTRVSLADRDAFLLMTRAIITLPNTFDWKQSSDYTLAVPNGRTFGALKRCGLTSAYTIPFLLVSPELGAVPPADINTIASFVGATSAQLWASEPINFTTGRLLLASSGQFLTSSEASNLGLTTGILTVSGGSTTIEQGAPAKPFSFKKWSGAGKATPFYQGDGSGSCTNTFSFQSDGSAGSEGGGISGGSDSSSGC
jgi:hypothetical protein